MFIGKLIYYGPNISYKSIVLFLLRPSDIFGQGDRFLRYFSGAWRHQGKWVPLYKNGNETIKQPVFVSDIAAGIVKVYEIKQFTSVYIFNCDYSFKKLLVL